MPRRRFLNESRYHSFRRDRMEVSEQRAREAIGSPLVSIGWVGCLKRDAKDARGGHPLRKLVDVLMHQLTRLPGLKQSPAYPLLSNCHAIQVKLWMFAMATAIPQMSAPLTFYGQWRGAKCSFVTHRMCYGKENWSA
jgi:hypothetical protein